VAGQLPRSQRAGRLPSSGRSRRRGGRAAVTALGGGHGLSASLQALRHVTDDLTAVVTVADDGGSSGRLRQEFGVLPPGDLRMALSALCDDSGWGHLWRDVLQHRFAGDGPLAGHPVGNLLIVALWQLLDDPSDGLRMVGLAHYGPSAYAFGTGSAGPLTEKGRGLLRVMDEVLTPDSSRFWRADLYQPGRGQPSLDKQPLRDWLEARVAEGRWAKAPPGPPLPPEVVAETSARYQDAFRRLTGMTLDDFPLHSPEAA